MCMTYRESTWINWHNLCPILLFIGDKILLNQSLDNGIFELVDHITFLAYDYGVFQYTPVLETIIG